MPISKRKKTCFSLIELSIVILIISILAAGAISVSGTFLISAKNKQTQDKMEAIYKAIGNYVAKNYHLPCPAPLTDTKSDSGYGVESGGSATTNTARACNATGVYSSNDVGSVSYGMVPVSSLGLSDEMAQDGFGTRFSYIVTNKLASPNYNNATGGTALFGFSYYSEVATDLIQVYQATSGNTIPNIAFAVIAHGPNKLGGYNSASATQNTTTGIGTEEGYNILSTIVSGKADFGKNASYLSRVTFTSLDTDIDFDDKLLYKTRSEIIDDFNLSFLYFCGSDAENDTTSDYTPVFLYGYSGQLVYGDGATGCDKDVSVFPSKECGPRGITWIDKNTCPPA